MIETRIIFWVYVKLSSISGKNEKEVYICDRFAIAVNIQLNKSLNQFFKKKKKKKQEEGKVGEKKNVTSFSNKVFPKKYAAYLIFYHLSHPSFRSY